MSGSQELTFRADLWEAEAMEAWVFVTVPAELTEEIRLRGGPPQGFGSVRVEVCVGGSTWRTSVFPDAKSGCFVLPVKRAIRKAEDLEAGASADFTLAVVAR